MRNIEVTGEIWQEGNMYTAYCHELDVASAGRSLNEARKNLVEALEIFFEETARKGTLRSILAEAGFPVEEDEQTQPLLSPRSRLCTLERLRIPVGSL